MSVRHVRSIFRCEEARELLAARELLGTNHILSVCD